jgi:hypothetical protein
VEESERKIVHEVVRSFSAVETSIDVENRVKADLENCIDEGEIDFSILVFDERTLYMRRVCEYQHQRKVPIESEIRNLRGGDLEIGLLPKPLYPPLPTLTLLGGGGLLLLLLLQLLPLL